MVPYGLAYLFISLFDAVAAAPYLALMPDIVSQAQVRPSIHFDLLLCGIIVVIYPELTIKPVWGGIWLVGAHGHARQSCGWR